MGDAHISVGTLRVLVIDDNRDGADSLARLLQLYGHEARAAYDGRIGLQTILDDPPDVVVCDLNLPGLHGLDVVNWKARQHHRYLDAIDRIQGRGVSVCGCFIVGLDADTPEVFDQIRAFVDA